MDVIKALKDYLAIYDSLEGARKSANAMVNLFVKKGKVTETLLSLLLLRLTSLNQTIVATMGDLRTLTSQLNESSTSLTNSSNRLEKLTWALIILTIILTVITLLSI